MAGKCKHLAQIKSCSRNLYLLTGIHWKTNHCPQLTMYMQLIFQPFSHSLFDQKPQERAILSLATWRVVSTDISVTLKEHMARDHSELRCPWSFFIQPHFGQISICNSINKNKFEHITDFHRAHASYPVISLSTSNLCNLLDYSDLAQSQSSFSSPRHYCFINISLIIKIGF